MTTMINYAELINRVRNFYDDDQKKGRNNNTYLIPTGIISFIDKEGQSCRFGGTAAKVRTNLGRHSFVRSEKRSLRRQYNYEGSILMATVDTNGNICVEGIF